MGSVLEELNFNPHFATNLAAQTWVRPITFFCLSVKWRSWRQGYEKTQIIKQHLCDKHSIIFLKLSHLILTTIP